MCIYFIWTDLQVDKENKQAGGLHWCTYRATVRRQGVYSSPTYGQVNFNEDLTAPMYNSISIVWDKVFRYQTTFVSLSSQGIYFPLPLPPNKDWKIEVLLFW